MYAYCRRCVQQCEHELIESENNECKNLIHILNANFYTDVQDLKLCALCDYIMREEGISLEHIIAVNK